MTAINETTANTQANNSQCEFESTLTKDVVAEKVQRCATHLMRLFWFGEERYHLLVTDPLPSTMTAKTVEVSKRILIGIAYLPTVILGVPCAAIAYSFSAIANVLNTRGYTFWEGEGKNNEKSETKVLHLNTCMFPGGLPLAFGGQTPASHRMDRLIAIIKKESPDVLCLSEVSRLFSSPLYDELKDLYPMFFVDIGLNGGGMESALFIACRDQVLTPPTYVPFQTPAEEEQKLMNRGALIFETPKCWYIYTHLHPKDSDTADQIRQKELDEVMEEIKKRSKGNKPFILLGDLNIDHLSKPQEYQKMINRGFSDPQQSSYIKHTCVDKDRKERVDYALVHQKETKLTLKSDILDTGLSDHLAIKLEVAPYHPSEPPTSKKKGRK